MQEWGSGCTIPLHQISYDMHRDLATELNLSTYRQITTLSVQSSSFIRRGGNEASWLKGQVSSSIMDNNTAQVTSIELTNKFMECALAAGSKLIEGTVNGIKIENSVVRGVSVEDIGIIDADKVILAMGPWTGALAEDWLGITLPMDGIKSTSIMFNGCDELVAEPFACFCEEDSNDCHLELYPRPNGDLYICGLGGSDHVSGDRLRPGGDCASSDLITGDTSRVTAACASLGAMTSVVDREPDVVQVSHACRVITYCFAVSIY
jgi:glycine/D-amino acid oxidase-like deaminating enzyme